MSRIQPRRWGKKLVWGVFISLTVIALGNVSYAEGDTHKPKKIDWSFNGPFGTFDRAALQRGLQVYREVCSSCHSLHHIRFGNLMGRGKSIDDIRVSNLGLNEEEATAIAADYKAPDLDDEGQPIERKAKLTDYFPAPYPNEKAARAANNGAVPPDLSLIIKARKGGADYVYSLLTGYEKAPKDVEIGAGRYYNPYFAGGQISMAQPLHTEGQVSYADGTKATVQQMASDVVTFLSWAAEPEMEDRKQMGVKVLFFLFFMTVLLYLAKRRIWRDVH